MMNLFMPLAGKSQVVAATTTAASVTVGGQGNSLMVYNDGPGLAAIRLGTGDAAVATDMPLPVGALFTLGWAPGMAVSVISASTSNVYVTPGNGE